ncbi:MAG: arginine biosynthesis protein ArgJ [Planctomycetota bacterium]|nr:MAG: arginine biosynthesis protein ArgJ [Planctomycetota bacterium]
MTFALPAAYRFAAVAAGIKPSVNKLDVSLVVSDVPAVAAGVYTTNKVFAAPVALDRSLTPGEGFRAVVMNSGNANACTGERGLSDAKEMARLAAATCGAEPNQALVLSTGVIGVFIPMDRVAAGIQAAAAKLESSQEMLVAAAQGMMTTDTVHKLAGRSIELSFGPVRVLGMAKGAAMIAPNMGTMLGLVLTDAPLSPSLGQDLLSAAVVDTFNCIRVDGHMSTNDTVLLLANGAALSQGSAKQNGQSLTGSDLAAFRTALHEVCAELAKAIPADGEGATHLVTIDVTGCRTRADAHKIAKSVAESPLVKTALAGADPNWGRIVSAVGYAGVDFDPLDLELTLNGYLLYRRGAPVPFDAAVVSKSIRDNRDTSIVLEQTAGAAAVRFWTTDLTAEYVRLNADYTT